MLPYAVSELFFFTTKESLPVFDFKTAVSSYCVVSEKTGMVSVGISGVVSRTVLRAESGVTCEYAPSNNNTSTTIFKKDLHHFSSIGRNPYLLEYPVKIVDGIVFDMYAAVTFFRMIKADLSAEVR